MAAPTTIPAGGSGAVLVGMTGFFMPARILVAPAGTMRLPLPRGVHAVVAVPAAGGSAGCRGGAAMRWAVAAAAAPAGGDDDDKLKEGEVFYGDLEACGLEVLDMLSCIEPPARLIGKASLVKESLENAVNKAKAKEDKMECVKALLLGIYGVIDLGKECAPNQQQASAAFINLDKEWFPIMVLAAKADDTAMMESVTRAMRIAKDILLRCIGHTADGADKLLRFEDPEDW